ncbi:DNA repair protein [Leptospira perolatii]|uniref:DNA repair protein n=1 Tax=Leptospira perolatii TaxID=2023191 RepID=A0A2M9ZNH6_9LEPT|nr:DNA repair protein [Leptospira perolatii]PJZ73626.1 DNA repair protein [Leptospira perolatii]
MIAVLLGKGDRYRPIEDLSREVLKVTRGLNGLLTYDSSRLKSIPGLGSAKASILSASVELAKRFKYQSLKGAPFRPKQLAAYMRRVFLPMKRECFLLATVSPGGRLLRTEVVSKGSLEEVGVHPRDLARIILNDEASEALIAHNHPGMSSYPSKEDIEVYERLGKILEELDVHLIDHWIFGIDGIFSCKHSTHLDEE